MQSERQKEVHSYHIYLLLKLLMSFLSCLLPKKDVSSGLYKLFVWEPENIEGQQNWNCSQDSKPWNIITVVWEGQKEFCD